MIDEIAIENILSEGNFDDDILQSDPAQSIEEVVLNILVGFDGLNLKLSVTISPLQT